MRSGSTIGIEGVVREILPNGLVIVLFRNGHQVTAHLSKRDRLSGKQFAEGEMVTVEMSPFDFSHGRIRI
ncbi:MAG: translation initiation factor IF-1 [Rhodobacteraceae bacterium]|nr:translation initiation factor IF-1 [Paracoccaceae bacterium]